MSDVNHISKEESGRATSRSRLTRIRLLLSSLLLTVSAYLTMNCILAFCSDQRLKALWIVHRRHKAQT